MTAVQKSDLDLTKIFENQEETSNDGITLEVQGKIPTWLRGSLLFTGGAKFHFDTMSVNHFADGFAMLSKYSISPDKGIVMFKKYLRSDALKKAQVAGRPVLAEFFTKSSTDVTKHRLGRWLTLVPENTDNGNHNLYSWGNKYFVANGLDYFWQIDPRDLSTLRKFDSNKLFGLAGITAHPLLDHDGTWYNSGGAVSASGAKQIIYTLPPPSHSNSSSKNPDDDDDDGPVNDIEDGKNLQENLKKYKPLVSFSMSRLMFCNVHHSFSMTENYLIMIDMPYYANIKRILASVVKGGPYAVGDNIEWDPEALGCGNKFRLFDKKTGKPIKINVVSKSPFFFLHYVNAFEFTGGEDGQTVHVVIDLLSFPNVELTDMMTLDCLKSGKCCPLDSAGVVHRYVIPLKTDSSSSSSSKINSQQQQQLLSKMHSEQNFGATAHLTADDDGGSTTILVTPGEITKKGITCLAINFNYRFKHYRYSYGTNGFYFLSSYGTAVVKFDLKLKTELKWTDGVEYAIGEICFVPKPKENGGQVEEDDGVLICPIQESTNLQRGCILILDAKSMTEISRAYSPSPIYPHSHVTFVPSLV